MSTRYDRLLSLSSFSKEDLKTLQGKKVLIIGVGGVGQHVAIYLVTNGIEHITIVDYDVVEISNLNRQILLTENDIGKSKVEVVEKALLARNSDAEIESINAKLTGDNSKDIITNEYDIVVDALDNWEGKFLISDVCHDKGIPFMHIGVDGNSGQFCMFKNKSLRDVLPSEVIKEKRDGVIGSVVGSVSALASTAIVDHFLGIFKDDELTFIDMHNNIIRKIKFNH